MTPKEKAGWLNERFYFSLPNNGSFTGQNNINQRWEEAKKCALIAVDETLSVVKYYEDKYTTDGFKSDNLLYWEEVKQELEKL